MKKVIESRNITGILFAKDSEFCPGEFIKYTDLNNTLKSAKPKKVKKKKAKKDDETRDTSI